MYLQAKENLDTKSMFIYLSCFWTVFPQHCRGQKALSYFNPKRLWRRQLWKGTDK